ncbi:LLM class flavin-dependent oxidoreductase [Frankia sp. AgB32]|uniref:LLM class flavin-dependent oxidoreductase n=1 Tax=Frankia sp. AgB32 TaxID=631119 RepID=UPI00200E5325|nr:LLM class flavin-dependent oxidoreductase [Frankia sp. AgB32]MCK9896095.1 LLM class flavin-dependent oxidoreductase [Frankia sp. AgB32]
MPASDPLHLAVALDGAGWHPAAWREPTARPQELFSPGYWVDLVTEAERGLLDFVTFEDSLALQSSRLDASPDGRTDQVRGRLDAVLIAARVAPLTSHVGLVPSTSVLTTEPFHLSKAIATLDYTSGGRAGWRVQVGRPGEVAHVGRRAFPPFTLDTLDSPEIQAFVAESFDEAADFVEVVRRLWDSWEDDAEIRDAATGRFVDREKLHYIDFEGRWFSVRGPSITPRPPQGQPLVTALAHATVPYRLAARAADVVHVTPHDGDQVRAIVTEIRDEQDRAGRAGQTLHVFADLVVVLDDDAAAARDRLGRLDGLLDAPARSDATIFAGSPGELADLLLDWQAAGLTGYRLRPAVLPDDLRAITRGLAPELARRGRFRTGYQATTLRGHLGLPRPVNRYAAQQPAERIEAASR